MGYDVKLIEVDNKMEDLEEQEELKRRDLEVML